MITDVYDGTHQTPNYTDSGVMFLSVEDIKTLKSKKYISKEAFVREFRVYPERGDILMTRIGDVGTPSVVESEEDIAYYVSLALLKKKEFNSYFLAANLQSSSAQRELWRRTLHIAFPKKINKNEISKILLDFPGKNEQYKIGGFFNTLNKLIALYQRKIELVKLLKSLYLKCMFLQKGHLLPEIRFGGFSGPWKRSRLLDNVDKVIDFRGRTPKKLGQDWSNEGYLALSALNVKNGYIDENVDAHYGNQKLYDAWMTGNELHQGQVLFTTEAPMGNVAQVPDNKGYILSQRTIAFDVDKKNIDENYLATMLSSPDIFRELTALSSGGTAKGVSQRTLSELYIPLPVSKREQTQIGTFLHTLDNFITVHQHKLDIWLNIKEKYLNSMFI